MKRLEPEDPMALVGVRLQQGPDDQALVEMARCFVEEYARMGWSGERIMRLGHTRSCASKGKSSCAVSSRRLKG